MAPQFTARERTFLSTKYHETKSPTEVQRLFRLQFPTANRVSCKGAVYKNVNKLNVHGTLRNRQPEASGRPRTARSQVNIARVRHALQQDQRSAQSFTQHSPSFCQIVRKDLNWYPYKL